MILHCGRPDRFIVTHDEPNARGQTAEVDCIVTHVLSVPMIVPIPSLERCTVKFIRRARMPSIGGFFSDRIGAFAYEVVPA